MKRALGCWLVAAGLAATVAGSGHAFPGPLAALPMFEPGDTIWAVGLESTTAEMSVGRVISRDVMVSGWTGPAARPELSVRLWAPLDLAPAFFAAEVSGRRLTGLLTLFFGPVSLDLGRSWPQQDRWALTQWVVHPRLSLVAGFHQTSQRTLPYVAWRLFPTATARWEIALSFDGTTAAVRWGGVL